MYKLSLLLHGFLVDIAPDGEAGIQWVANGHQPDAIVLTISDNGSGATERAGESTGHGLIGMRERVELFGGELGAGSSSLGGFTVRARLPLA